MTPRDKARLLGLLFWIFAGFNVGLVTVIAVVYVVIFGAVFSNMPHKHGEPGPEVILPMLIIIFAFALFFVILFSIPKIVAGYGLRNGKSWARIWAIIASIIACMSFPFGTAIGVFGLVFLFGDDGKRYFDSPDLGIHGLVEDLPVRAPEPNIWM
ncbi:MAG: hypothetical protein ABJA02_14740 [Acidobacteriota bacterium]